jgi:hypothetical protein
MKKRANITKVIGRKFRTDAASLQWLNDLKARPNVSPAELVMIEALDAAWRAATHRRGH